MSDAGITEILTADSPVLPDYAMLGGRLFLTDGGHCNKVILDADGSWRPMGAREQSVPLSLSYEETAGGPLVRGQRVTYALRRVVTARGLEVPGGLTVEYLQIPLDTEADPDDPPAACAVTLTVMPYEYTVGSGTTVKYEIYRSKSDNTQLLYLCATLTQSQVDALSSNRYTDMVADAELPVNFTINLDADGMDLTIPPCRYVRAWRGCLVCGGYRRRSASVSGAKSSTLLTTEEGAFTADDIGCYLTIPGEEATRQIVSVNDASSVVIDSALTTDHDGSEATVWRDDDVVYISRPLPGNIEVYSAESGRLISNQGADNTITGIASNGSYAYVFRQNSVEIITGTPAAPELEPFPGSPPGCRSHATIADHYAPFIIYYAGVCGVWLIAGQEAKRVSARIDRTIKEEIDHSQDQFSHAVYDPATSRYWLFVFSKRWRETGIRMPDMLLIYDAQTSAWTRGELSASRSGLWRDSAGELIPVIGVPRGVARLGLGDEDGPVEVVGTVSSVDGGSFGITVASGDLSKVVAGMPVLVGDMPDVSRRIVESVDGRTVTVYGSMPQDCVGDAIRIGSIRWGFSTPEVGIAGYWDRYLKLETLSVCHGRSAKPLPVRLELTGINEISDEPSDKQVWSDRVDFSTRTVSRVDGRATGLRAASVQLRVEALSSPALIKAVRIDMTKVAR